MLSTRFPHTCVIYRITDATPFSDGVREIVWHGTCRKESNTSIRSFTGKDDVIKSDYRIQLGHSDASHDDFEDGETIHGLEAGMFADVTDAGGTYEMMSVSDVYAGTLGTTLYVNLAKT